MYVSIWFETKRAPKLIYKSKHFEKQNLTDALKYKRAWLGNQGEREFRHCM